jgi:hypothetical protein
MPPLLFDQNKTRMLIGTSFLWSQGTVLFSGIINYVTTVARADITQNIKN